MDLARDSKRHILGKLPLTEFLAIYPHSSAVSHNLHKNAFDDVKVSGVESFLQHPRELPYEVTYPLPVNRPPPISKAEINGMDPGLQILVEKSFWEKKKTDLLKYCLKKDANNIHESDTKAGRSISLPLSMVRLADHFGKDPDPHLTNNYNVYYTGGNLSCLTLGSCNYLVLPKKRDKKNYICLESISSSGASKSLLVSEKADLSCGDAIFQTEVRRNLIVARHKKKVTLFSVNEETSGGEVCISKAFCESNDVPFFSVALHDRFVCTTAAKRQLKVFDIETRKGMLEGCIERDEGTHMADCWCSISGLDKNTLCFVDRTCIGFIDLRSKTTLANKWPIDKVTEHCEEIFCSAASTGSPSDLVYLATSHQLLGLDPKGGFSQKWSHGITHSPAYLAVSANTNRKDRIFIGSQISDSVVFIENNIFVGTALSTSHPYLLPNLSDTFHAARYHGTCLGTTVASRFSMCLTGLCAVENERGVDLFRLTSAGDLFGQTLTKSFSRNDIDLREEDIDKLDQWEQDCEDLFLEESKTCIAAHLADDRNIVDLIKSGADYKEEAMDRVCVSAAPWGISKAELASYCDYLAPRLLKQWGLEDMTEWGGGEPGAKQGSDEEVLASSSEEEDMTEKVAQWIQRNQKDEEDVDDPYLLSEASSGDEVIEMDPDDELAEEIELPPSPSEHKPSIASPLPSSKPLTTTPKVIKKTAGF